MAISNDNNDQKARSWGERAAEMARKALGIEQQGTIKDAEDAVKKLRKRKGRA